MERQLLRGGATTLVLLLLRDEPSHGYRLVQEIRRRSREHLVFGEGTIYPLLYTLEGSGMIAGGWKSGAGIRRRKVYRLTPKGHRQLARRLEEWERFEKGMRFAVRDG